MTPGRRYSMSDHRAATTTVTSSTGSDSSDQITPDKPSHLHYLNDFRVDACPLFKQHQCQQHRPFTCFNWHFSNQRRRRPVKKRDGSFNYSPDIYCDKYDENTGICPDGDKCIYLHRVSGDVERKYHLRYYKTAQCVHPTDSRGQCVKNGAHCAFAHTSNDIRQPQFDQQESGFSTSIEGELRDRTSFVIEDPQWHSQDHVLSYYKTEQCRKPPRLCRQGYACPFYHNSKDRRRPPSGYKSTPCPAAKTVDEWLDPDLCDAGDTCQYCHTRTEQQFHPEIYKSTKCNDMLEHGYCPRAVFCAFAHHDSELHATRIPFSNSQQASPKEQCSPNTNGFQIPQDQISFGSPIANGSSPSYSSMLKQRPVPAQPMYQSDLISSSYPKAPGFERGPLSPIRSDQRLRTYSLNMGQLEMARRTMLLGNQPENTLQSQSSLCRSDSGFNAISGGTGDNSLATLEELSLDLGTIDEHQPSQRFMDLFSSNCSVTSPVRIPGADYQNPFGDQLFQNPISPSNPADLFKNSYQDERSDYQAAFDLRSQQELSQPWEDANRKSYEELIREVDHYKKVAEKCHNDAMMAIMERDKAIQQLEHLKIQISNTIGAGLLQQQQQQTSPLQMSNNPGPDMERFNTSSPYTIFSPDSESQMACARCGRDKTRSNSDSQSSCPLCKTDQ